MSILALSAIELFSPFSLSGQLPALGGGGSAFDGVAESVPCVTTEDQEEWAHTLRQMANELMAEQPELMAELQARTAASRGGVSHVLFESPIRRKAEFDDPGYYAVTNFVDHNLAPSALTDYNCGTRTYDWATGNHQGTDLILWPYPWQRMDEDVMEVVAAAPGIILTKIDGNTDRSCILSGSTLWNAIYLLHADSSISWYLHFQLLSLTSKPNGSLVETGEYLGSAGSSGSSTIPHLHFQVFDKDDQVIDPYSGSCNGLNPDSWWESQPNYWEPQVNRISVHNALPVEDCPDPEIPNEALEFDPGDTVIMILWYKDLLNGALTNLEVERPDGSIYQSWNFVSPWDDYPAAWAYWNLITSPEDALGRYVFRANFNKVDYEREFYLGDAPLPSGLSAMAEPTAVRLYPNPASGPLHLVLGSGWQSTVSVQVYNWSGQVIFQQVYQTTGSDTRLSISPSLPPGCYTLSVQDGNRRQSAKWIQLETP